jgi:hypothetical protein
VVPVQKAENMTVEIRHADHVATFYPQKLALTSPISGGRLVGIVCRRRPQSLVLRVYIPDNDKVRPKRVEIIHMKEKRGGKWLCLRGWLHL